MWEALEADDLTVKVPIGCLGLKLRCDLDHKYIWLLRGVGKELQHNTGTVKWENRMPNPIKKHQHIEKQASKGQKA